VTHGYSSTPDLYDYLPRFGASPSVQNYRGTCVCERFAEGRSQLHGWEQNSGPPCRDPIGSVIITRPDLHLIDSLIPLLHSKWHANRPADANDDVLPGRLDKIHRLRTRETVTRFTIDSHQHVSLLQPSLVRSASPPDLQFNIYVNSLFAYIPMRARLYISIIIVIVPADRIRRCIQHSTCL